MTEPTRYSRRQRLGLVGGPVLFALTRLFVTPSGLSPEANAVLASTLWVACWWLTEAVPIPVTSLLPVVLFPAQGVAGVVETTAPYADPVVFLFLGGFLVALAIERWGLHRRIALTVLARAGEDTHRLILGFMVATAGLSMWVSNTATAMMMLPIGTAVVAHLDAWAVDGTTNMAESPVQATGSVEGPLAVGEGPLSAGEEPQTAGEGPQSAGEGLMAAGEGPLAAGEGPLAAGEVSRSNFGAALLLGIAYGASIGGVATLIGTPPNAILAGVLRSTYGVELGFVEWMLFGLPLAAVFLLVAWVVLLRVLPPEFRETPGSQRVVEARLAALGPMSRGERRVVVVFALVVAGWVTRPFLLEPVAPGVTDAVIAVAGGVLVFLVPVDLERGEFLLNWEATTRVPWGVLLLFGSGFSLARMVAATGLDRYLADSLSVLRGADALLVVLAVATVVVFLTEVTSNSATATLLIPVTGALAVSLSVPPLVLMVVVAVGASFAFMLPVATPPNAVVFGSGYVTLPQMARVGFWLNLLGILLVTAMATAWLPVVWNG